MNRKSEYLSELQDQCSQTIAMQNLQIHTFLFKVVFNESYYNLIREREEKVINYDIARILLYPQITTQNIQQLTTLIPVFFYFVKGLQLEIELIIKHDPENFWDFLFTGLAYKINHQFDVSDKNIDKFKENLEERQLQDLEKEKDSIEYIIQDQTILKYLDFMFLEDAPYIMAHQNTKTQEYSVFLAQQQQKIITNIFDQLSPKFLNTKMQSIDYYKMKVGVSILRKDYTQIPYNDFLESGTYIFSLIQLDHRQFTAFFSHLQITQQQQLLQKITSSFDEGSFYRLLLLGRSLSKLRLSDEALKIFNFLLNKIKMYPRKEQYRIYIKFKICKLLLLQCETQGLIKSLKKIDETIEQYNGINFFQTSQQIYYQCLFLQLLLSSYLNKKDSLKYVSIKIQNLNIYHGGFSLLQVQFIKLILSIGVIFTDNKGERQLNHILSSLQEYVRIKQNIKTLNCNINQFQAAIELLTLNALLQHRDIQVLQYLNRKYAAFFKNIVCPRNFNTELQAQINFFLHDFESALKLTQAQKNKDYKLLAQIYEQQEKYDEAIENYRKIFSPSIQFQCAMILRIKGDYQKAFELFRNLENQSQYQYICKIYRQEIQNTQEIVEIQQAISWNSQIISSTSSIRASRLYSTISLNNIFTRNNSQLGQSVALNQGEQSQYLSQSDYYYPTENINYEDYFQGLGYTVREDISYFYKQILDDAANSKLTGTLNDFVEKTKEYSVESIELFANNNDRKELIGQGGQGSVYRFEYKGNQYAAKVIEISYTGKPTIADIRKIENQLKEICILCGVSQSNIKYILQLKHIGFQFKFYGKTKVTSIYLLTDLHNQYQLMRDWDMEHKIQYIFKLSLTLFTLQDQLKILHLDLKPQNVLVDSKNNPVLIDFGLSKNFTHSISGCFENQFKTFIYSDPDIEQRSRKNDVYSFGVSVYQYITNEIPYKGQDSQLILQGNFFDCHSKQIGAIQNEFIRKLIIDCTKNIKERITFLDVVQRFFQFLYQNHSYSILQLINLLFNHFKELDSQKQQYFAYFWLLKKFLKRMNQFVPQESTDEDTYVHQFKFENDITLIFPQIISKIQQLSKWIKLSSINGVQKLLNFKITIYQIINNVKSIEFAFIAEQVKPLRFITTNNQWKLQFIEIGTILNQIHKNNIYLYRLPKFCCCELNGQIKINYYQISQNNLLDNISQLDYQFMNIIQNKFHDTQNDISEYAILLKENIFPKLDQAELQQNKDIQESLNACLEGQNITLDQLIQALQK